MDVGRGPREGILYHVVDGYKIGPLVHFGV
jgi:hypothetical protein